MKSGLRHNNWKALFPLVISQKNGLNYVVHLLIGIPNDNHEATKNWIMHWDGKRTK